ncbi:MAG: hypothetical protein QXW05_01105 [Ignisphaera sp.]
MPPTDMVKKLSRTDHRVENFTKFLYIQGVLTEGLENLYANPLPFSSTVPMINEDIVKFYRCLAMSLCLERGEEKAYVGNTIDLGFVKLMSIDNFRYTTKDEKLYIYNLNDKYIDLIMKRKVEEIALIDLDMREKRIDIGKDAGHRYTSVYALSIKMNNRDVLSIAFSEPIIIESIGESMYRLYVPMARVMAISRNRTHVQMFREVLIYSNTVVVIGKQKNVQSLIEILDPIALSKPIDFIEGCVDLEMVNPINISYNTIIKVYGYIDEITVDDLVKFKPKYNIIRIALPRNSKAKIRLCISSSIPKRAELLSAFKEVSQVF